MVIMVIMVIMIIMIIKTIMIMIKIQEHVEVASNVLSQSVATIDRFLCQHQNQTIIFVIIVVIVIIFIVINTITRLTVIIKS